MDENKNPSQYAPIAEHAQQAEQVAEITQEQIVLGHFCRHAIVILGNVMENNPRKAEAEANLKEHIKSTWIQWVTQQIPRQRLLESVASFVRSSCPEASHIDAIVEFQTWYEREFELKKRRTEQVNDKLN